MERNEPNVEKLVDAYNSCRSREEKIELAKHHGLSIEQLYNIVSRRDAQAKT